MNKIFLFNTKKIFKLLVSKMKNKFPMLTVVIDGMKINSWLGVPTSFIYMK